MSKMNSLRDLFDEQLKVLYCAEQKFQQVLPKIVDKVSSEDLKQELSNQIEVEEDQVNRLKHIFKNINLEVKSSNCPPMDGIVDEIKNIINQEAEASVMDAAIIAEVQKALHFKIACYGTLRTYADMLEFNNVANEMKNTLNEEKESDRKLTGIAQTINADAVEGSIGQR